MERKRPLIVILGQTATGKSAFAVQLARKINGEVVSADSRQVYKGLNLGTGKITKKDMAGIQHHLLDVADPKKRFSVDKFRKLAEKSILEIIVRGKIPIIVGGTGLYIDTLINGSSLPSVPPNISLRKKLANLSRERLFKMLKNLDPRRANEIDRNNPVRLIRAIEIAKALGKVPKVKNSSKYHVLKIGLAMSDEILKNRIRVRLYDRLKKGMLKEAKKLHTQGLPWKRMEELGLEYRYMARCLQGKLSKEEMINELEKEIWRYAKRQKTWFKRDKDIVWIKIF